MLAGVGEMKAADLDAALAKYGVVAPDTKNPIGKCFPFNLMFKTSIGPKGDLTGYLRPETAQVGVVLHIGGSGGYLSNNPGSRFPVRNMLGGGGCTQS